MAGRKSGGWLTIATAAFTAIAVIIHLSWLGLWLYTPIPDLHRTRPIILYGSTRWKFLPRRRAVGIAVMLGTGQLLEW